MTGYKRDENGGAVVSRLNLATLDTIARGTGGRAFRITPADTSLSGLAAAIEGMEQKAMAREYSYRRKERFQVPLAIGLACLALGLLLPPPPLRWPSLGRRSVENAAREAAALVLALRARLSGARAGAPGRSERPRAGTDGCRAPSRTGRVLDEVLLRPRRDTEKGRGEYARGNHPQALSAFERAAEARPPGPGRPLQRGRRPLQERQVRRGGGPLPRPRRGSASPVAASSRYNLGNSLFQKKDYRGSIQAYRDALRVAPGDEDTRRNLEMALRALQEQEEQKKKQEKDQKDQQQKKDQQGQDSSRRRIRRGSPTRRDRTSSVAPGRAEPRAPADATGAGRQALQAGSGDAPRAGTAAARRPAAEREGGAEEAPGRRSARRRKKGKDW